MSQISKHYNDISALTSKSFIQQSWLLHQNFSGTVMSLHYSMLSVMQSNLELNF